MRSINKVQLIGEVVNVYPSSFTENGTEFVKAIIKTTHSRTDRKTDEYIVENEFHRIVFYNAMCKRAKEFIRLNCLTYLEGYIRSRKIHHSKINYEEWKTEIIATQLVVLLNQIPDPNEL